MLSSKLKILAVVAAVSGAVLAVSMSAGMADNTNAWGQVKKEDPSAPNPGDGGGNTNSNGSGGQSHAFRGNTNSPGYEKRCENGHGRGCGGSEEGGCEVTGTCPPPPPPPPVASDEDLNGDNGLNCDLLENKNDPRCAAPAKKSAKRKIVTAKLATEEQAVAPAPVVADVQVQAPAAEVVAAANVTTKVKSETSAGSTDNANLGTINFQ